ncbi:MAG TPA: mechanosensitive ion channel domain-containing protein [Chitinophagaceae bacterium]|nr:mechanosensitive ion channel domain-containing protein [Chitinophagaceae bacterium]
MKYFYGLIIYCFSFINAAVAQDTTRLDTLHADTLRQHTMRLDSNRRRSFDTSLFADNNTMTGSDYLLQIQKMFQTLNQVPVITGSFDQLDDIARELNESDTALGVIKERLSVNDRTLNLRNLQMFYTLLEAIQDNDKKYSDQLNKYDNKLDALKKELLDLRKDTTLRQLFRDSILRKSFVAQFKTLRAKWGNTDTLIKTATSTINTLKTHASSNSIAVTEMLYQTNNLLARIGPRAFTKERNYLWEPLPTRPKKFSGAENFKKSINNENKAVRYYFSNTRSKRIWLFLTGIIFFYWVFSNYRVLKKKNKLSLPESFHFKYINPVPVAACLVCMLTLAPLFDLHAPAIYIEVTQFLLMLVLTGLFWKRWPERLFLYWCGIVILFVLLSLTRILALPFYLQRWWVLFISGGAIVVGLLFWQRLKKAAESKVLFFATAIYIFFNFLAVACNIFGRLTLTQIFGYTSVYTFAQVISLVVFIQSLEEAFLLQIHTSRVKKNYPVYFDTAPIIKGINKLVTVLAVIICLMAFTINLNVYNFVFDLLKAFLVTPQEIGSVSFTFGGIVLFLCIIWIANFLQKYIAYFFGDIGDDAAVDNKGERSRLMITRLILLIAGFLLAVAALGLPVDKITVILGALGVGIGLGLQGIVNNFVSGIILIFDRPLRIGDTVEVADKKGRVKEISIRSSTLLTPDGAEVIIPNGDLLSHNIINWTLSNNHVRAELTITADNLQETDEIKNGFIDITKNKPNILSQRPPEVLFTYLKGKTVQMLFLFWCKDVARLETTKSEIGKEVYALLEQKGINVV